MEKVVKMKHPTKAMELRLASWRAGGTLDDWLYIEGTTVIDKKNSAVYDAISGNPYYSPIRVVRRTRLDGSICTRVNSLLDYNVSEKVALWMLKAILPVLTSKEELGKKRGKLKWLRHPDGSGYVIEGVYKDGVQYGCHSLSTKELVAVAIDLGLTEEEIYGTGKTAPKPKGAKQHVQGGGDSDETIMVESAG